MDLPPKYAHISTKEKEEERGKREGNRRKM